MPMMHSAPKRHAAQTAPATAARYRCRHCDAPLTHTFVDLGTSPLCQRHVTPAQFDRAEAIYPLHAYVCDTCWLVQLPAYVAADEIFDDQYAYFSSYSDSWLAHCKAYTQQMITRLKLNKDSKVCELASNDGYLLQYFVQAGIPVLGIEPTANTAAEAEKKGVKSLVKFFGKQTATQVAADWGKPNLLLGNNVLAHVPDINDFVGGMKIVLAPGGTVTIEFPHLLTLMRFNQFDTIYHEHYSYLSFAAVERIFAHHGMTLFDVDELPTHGGSLRIYAKHADDPRPIEQRVVAIRQKEADFGIKNLETYAGFAEQVRETKRKLLEFLIQARRDGKRIVGYGAPGKGNTLLNYCGIRTDFLDYTVDRNPHKQGNYLPGSRIPIVSPDRIMADKPDYVLILPWNLRDEISKQMAGIRDWGGKFVVPIPSVSVF
jgi:C-methyltransferase C-terminal domain/Putative zinc binding domain/Methyltransferase domain